MQADLPPPGPPPGKGGNNYQLQQQNYNQNQNQNYNQNQNQNYDQNQNQNYTQQPPNYGQNYAPGPNGTYTGYQGQGDKPAFTEAFKIDKPKYNDLWAGILLVLVFAGFVAVSVISLRGYTNFKGGGSIYNNRNNFGLNTNTMVLFAFVLVMALVLSWLYVMVARLFTKQFIWVTGILHILFGFVTAIYMLSRKYYSGGIVFLIFSLFSAFCFYSWIPRIPFSVVMLQTSIDVSKKYGHVYSISFIGGIISVAFGAWYSMTLVAIYAKYEPGNSSVGANPACAGGAGCSSGKVIGLVVFITFAMYWISEWLKNTIHVVNSGVYGAWYFNPNNPARGATRGALRRALTYSFGSISFGSLIVAIINALRQLCSIAQNQAGMNGNMVGAIFLCVLQCLIGILQWAVEFINTYAFCYIALYGASYITAAKDTWKMMKDRGIDALVNECLIGPVLTMGSTFVAYACALLAYLYLVFTAPTYNANGDFTVVVVAFSFVIGLQIANIFTTPINSGVETIFVAMAWDPEVLMQQHPDLYQRMITVYPHVQQAIHA